MEHFTISLTKEEIETILVWLEEATLGGDIESDEDPVCTAMVKLNRVLKAAQDKEAEELYQAFKEEQH